MMTNYHDPQCDFAQPSSRTMGKVIPVSVRSQDYGPMFVIEKEKSRGDPHGGLPPSLLRIPERTRPSPHDVPSERRLYCSVVKVDSTAIQPAEKKRRRRKHAVTEREIHTASFFRPQQEWGGKSAGYALGYVGSRPIPMGSTRQWRYRRDNMKQGVVTRW